MIEGGGGDPRSDPSAGIDDILRMISFGQFLFLQEKRQVETSVLFYPSLDCLSLLVCLHIFALLQKALPAITALSLFMDGWEFDHIFLGIAELLEREGGHFLSNLLLMIMLIQPNHILKFSFISIFSIRPLFLSFNLITTKTRRPWRYLWDILLINFIQKVLGISYIEVLL